MVLIKEYRIPMPYTVKDYQRGQLYMTLRMSKEETGGGEGIEIVENKPYEDEEHGKGQFTHKRIHLSSRLPGWVKLILPADATVVDEKSWNAYPYSKTEYSVPYFIGRLRIEVETMYLDDAGTTENAFNCSADILKQRIVDVIDLATDPFPEDKYDAAEDPLKVRAEKISIGPLAEGWVQTTTPMMTAYKLVTIEFKYWGLQTKMEAFIHSAGFRDTIQHGHRRAYCWTDDWWDMTMEDIREYEKQIKEELDELLKQEEGAGA